ncbi:MAG: transglutaminase-like domain-containing protein, partial [Planctomycetota bacterium]
AALCRAAGIPARVVLGYAYCDYYNGKWNVFVPHAWTEVFIGDKWIGLDATKNRFFGMFNSFTAGYIALSGIGDKPDLSGTSALGAFKILHVQQ